MLFLLSVKYFQLFCGPELLLSLLTRPFVFQVGENFVPPLLDAVLIDYQRNVPAAREPEVLSTMATIVNKLGGHITTEIPQIFDAVFECTLNMINKVRTAFSAEFPNLTKREYEGKADKTSVCFNL